MGRPEDSRVKIPVLVYFTKEMQVVGGPNSTGEGMNKNKYWREVERELCLAVLACETISKRKH